MAPVVEGEGKSTHPVTAYLPDVTAAPPSLHSGGHGVQILILIDARWAGPLSSPFNAKMKSLQKTSICTLFLGMLQ